MAEVQSELLLKIVNNPFINCKAKTISFFFLLITLKIVNDYKNRTENQLTCRGEKGTELI